MLDREELRFVAIRDDDTNALTPVECLDQLYRPFLERCIPVNLAVIPNVRTDITYGAGIPEGFLFAKAGDAPTYLPIGSNQKLVCYLRDNPGFTLLHHGYTHEFIDGRCEFELSDPEETARRLDCGRKLFADAGLGQPDTFVAPYDRFTRQSLAEIARHFRVISANWYELAKLPHCWWPSYLKKRILRRHHWRAANTLLLTHPGCHLSYQRSFDTMFDTIKHSIQSRRLTVLVTHWWEFFRGGLPNWEFIEILHRTADYLATINNVRPVSFQQIAAGEINI